MTEETLKKANDLVNRLEECRVNLRKIEYTQSEDVVIRETDLILTPGKDVTVPKNLFRIIGKLIKAEYIQEIDKLQKELDEL